MKHDEKKKPKGNPKDRQWQFHKDRANRSTAKIIARMDKLFNTITPTVKKRANNF